MGKTQVGNHTSPTNLDPGFSAASVARWRGSPVIIALTVFLLAKNWRSVLNFVAPGVHADLLGQLSQWQRMEVQAVIWIGLCFVGLLLVYRQWDLHTELGIRSDVLQPFLFALLATMPMLLAFAATSSISPEVTVASILHLAIISPFAEEVLYRGYLFRQLYRRAGWGFIPSVLVTAVAFGLGHFADAMAGGNWMRALGTVGITALGGAFFAWLFVRWEDNLWVPFAIHALMNLWWQVFAVDSGALGGWLANGARLLTVVLAILITLYGKRIWTSFFKH